MIHLWIAWFGIFCLNNLTFFVLSLRFHSKLAPLSTTKIQNFPITSLSYQVAIPFSLRNKVYHRSRIFSFTSNEKNSENRHIIIQSLLNQAKHAFATASISPITPDSFQKWLQVIESFVSSLDMHKNNFKLLQELYFMLLNEIPVDAIDLLHLATIDRINVKVMETMFQTYQSSPTFSLREFVDLLNDAHLSFIDSLFNQNNNNNNRNINTNMNKNINSNLHRAANIIDAEQQCHQLYLIFERVFLTLNNFQFLDVSRRSTIPQQLVQNWLSPLEARLVRRVSSYVMGSSLSRRENMKNSALQQMLKRLAFQLPLTKCCDTQQDNHHSNELEQDPNDSINDKYGSFGAAYNNNSKTYYYNSKINNNDNINSNINKYIIKHQYHAAELASFVATLIRHTVDISDDTSLRDTQDACYLETRRTLAAHLSPLLLPATHLRHIFKLWQEDSPSLIPPLTVHTSYDIPEMHRDTYDELCFSPEGLCHRLLSRDTVSPTSFNFVDVAQQWLTVTQECVAATLLSWQLKHSFMIMKLNENNRDLQENETVEQLRTKFGDFSHDKGQLEGTKERLDAIEKRFEQKQSQDNTNEDNNNFVSLKCRPLTLAEKLKRLPLLTATQSPFVLRHDETPVSRSLLTRAMLSLPCDTRDTVSFALKNRFKKLGVSQLVYDNTTIISNNNIKSNSGDDNDLFLILQRQLASQHTPNNNNNENDEEDSVLSDMARLNVLHWYNNNNNNIVENSNNNIDNTMDNTNVSFETQLAVALMYNHALKEEANFKFRALNLYNNNNYINYDNNNNERLLSLNSDAQFECNLAVILMDYLGAPLFLTTSNNNEHNSDDVFLKRLVSQCVLDPVLATPNPSLSATQVLFETACVATNSLVNFLLATQRDKDESVSRRVVERVSQRFTKAATAVRHMFIDDDTFTDNNNVSIRWRHSVLNKVIEQWVKELTTNNNLSKIADNSNDKERDTHETPYQEKVSLLRRLCRNTLSRLFDVSPDVAENLLTTRLVTQFDTRVTTLLLDNIATPRDTSFIRNLGHTMETQLLCLTPVSPQNSVNNTCNNGNNDESNLIFVSQFRKRVAKLTAQILTQLLNIATQDYLTGHTQKLHLVRHRCVTLLRHPLLTHICHSDSNEGGVSQRYILQLVTQQLVQQDTPSSSSPSYFVSRRSVSLKLVDVLRCVEAMLRHRGHDTAGSTVDGWAATHRDTAYENSARFADEKVTEATDMLSELQQLLLEEYAKNVAF